MASIQNRSRWFVRIENEEQTFRLKSEAQAFFDSFPSTKRKEIKQLETTFEAQIKLKDKHGNTVKRTMSHPSFEAAEKWAKEEEERILDYKKEHGKFDLTYETMTFEQALEQTLEEHYKGKASYKENKYRIPYIIERIGKKTLLKDVNQQVLLKFRRTLEADGYSPASIRNFFVVISATLKQAQMEWLFPVDNHAKKIKLEKPDNAIERNWETPDERERLFIAIKNHSPWLLPIVEMSLEMAFRLGELVKDTEFTPDAEFFGLRWEGVNFENETVRILREKNDWQKRVGESKGRTVPMTKRMKAILLELRGDFNIKKTGPVFQATSNSVGHAFKRCCDNANPPIENLTFHSLRKIATYNLSKHIDNPILLGRLTGHRDIKTLSDRYYKVPIEDLKALINQFDETDIKKRGILILQKHLGIAGTAEFLKKVRESEPEYVLKTEVVKQVAMMDDEIAEAEPEAAGM